jgi:hypothetical protein
MTLVTPLKQITSLRVPLPALEPEAGMRMIPASTAIHTNSLNPFVLILNFRFVSVFMVFLILIIIPILSRSAPKSRRGNANLILPESCLV